LVTVVAQGYSLILKLAIGAVLGRLLAPEDFGLLAVGMLVADAAIILRDFGLSTSIIQRETLSNEQLDRLFVWSALLSLLTGGAIALSGEPLSHFFGEPRLVMLTPWLGVTMFVAGLGIVPLNLLQRQLKLDVVGANTVISATIGAVVAISLAYAGWGVKALIAQAVVGTTVSTLIAWWNAGWHPTGMGRKAEMKSIFTQSAGAGGAHLLTYASRNFDNVIVGKLVGMGPLGYYTRAYQFTQVPPQLVQAISAVAVPALSRLQGEPARFREAFMAMHRAVMFVSLPPLVAMVALGPEITLTLLGPKWGEAGELLRVLGLGALVLSTGTATGWTSAALGQTGRQFVSNLVCTTLMFVSFLIGSRWGAMGVAWGGLAGSIVARAFALPYSLAKSPIRPSDVATTISRSLVASIAGGMAGFVAAFVLRGQEPVVRLIAGSVAFAATWAGVWFASAGGRAEVFGLFALLKRVRAGKGAV
jgi:PST family polysaccharide transporter